MAPGTAAGAAHPVALIGPVQLKHDDEMKRKIENDTAALMRSFTSKRGRNIEAARKCRARIEIFHRARSARATSHRLRRIDPRRSFSPDPGKDLQTVQRRVCHAQPRRTNDRSVRYDAEGKHSRQADGTDFSFLLLAIGGLALYVEFNHPGAVIPGTIGVVFILLAAFALNLLPTRFAALGLILGAFALFAAEAKFVTHGVLTIGGIVLLTLGGLLLVDSPIPEMRVHLLTALAVSIPFGLITAFLMTIARQSAAQQSGHRSARLDRAKPEWRRQRSRRKARSSFTANSGMQSHPPTLSVGQLVVVRQVDGLTVQVDPLGATAPPGTPEPAIL